MSDAETEAVEGIDEKPVTRWFVDHLPQAAPPLRFERVAGGHSCLTFIVTDHAGARFVLRRPPLGHVLATAHDVVREHRVMSALWDSEVAVPQMLGLCTDAGVNGAPFYVMSHVEGVVLHNAAAAVAGLPSEPARRRAAESLVDALVALHAVDVDAVGLGAFARRTGYLDRQLKRWASQWASSKTSEIPGMERLHDWLVENRPEVTGSRILHGDYRLGNALHGPDGTVRAVLDWELCTLGDPLADVSYLLHWWDEEQAGVPPELARASTAPGFPTREEVAARYAAATGVRLGDLHYWMAFHAWRLAAIAAGVYRRYLDGDMGASPVDLEQHRRSITASCEAGLRAAGIA